MSDYLWDKTGEPDEDAEQLEQLLGTLKYQPRPLEIPATVAALPARSRTILASASDAAPICRISCGFAQVRSRSTMPGHLLNLKVSTWTPNGRPSLFILTRPVNLWTAL